MTQSVSFRRAGRQDDPIIRQLLRETPMQGAVHIAMEREPDASLAAGIEGYRHNITLAIDDKANNVLGMGGRAVRECYINGQLCNLGYLGQLRVRSGKFAGRRLAEAFKAMGSDRKSDEMPFDLTSIIADNSKAIRLLTTGRGGLPVYDKFARVGTFILPVSSKPGKIEQDIEQAKPDDLAEIAEFLQQQLSSYQFAPHWTKDMLESDVRCRGLSAGDFLLKRKQGKIQACLALWDQREFKQIKVTGYSGPLSRLRPLLNGLLFLQGKPRLPAAGKKMRLAYLSHVAVDNNDPGIFAELVCTARRLGKLRGLDYLAFGFAENHPLHDVVRSCFGHYRYVSNLYTVHWNGEVVSSAIAEDQVPYVEVATL